MARDLTAIRESYEREGLRRRDLGEDPITQFEKWWDEWAQTDPYDAAACVLATVSSSGQPSARFVLCREFDLNGFVVYTNLESHKGLDLAANPKAAITFGWLDLSRQVRIEGPVTHVEDAAADEYWSSRPRGSQIGAWASEQSRPVSGRAELDQRQAEVVERFGGPDATTPIERPPHWGGYRVGIERIEFWQGQPDRLHDRFEYRRDVSEGSEGPGGWKIRRLAP
ncbi:MAG: pyridoxamine 5'-phosphate oxidase [Acidimicrobiales bacterium]|nr:pyridoxamine 5'-phosphate oxidase [Acidimicrobiales bacterium]